MYNVHVYIIVKITLRVSDNNHKRMCDEQKQAFMNIILYPLYTVQVTYIECMHAHSANATDFYSRGDYHYVRLALLAASIGRATTCTCTCILWLIIEKIEYMPTPRPIVLLHCVCVYS